MAHMTQEKKAKINAALKAVMPKGWKYTLAVRNHATIVCTIKSAPKDLVALSGDEHAVREGHYRVNHYWYASHIKNAELVAEIAPIIAALNTDNWDRSDIQTDYFDVGHYITLQFGTWDKRFEVKA